MTESKSRTEPVSRMDSWADVIADGGQAVLYDSDWNQYERFRDHFANLGFGRVSYCDGIIEIMSLSQLHERVSQILSFIIQFYASHTGVMVDSVGSATIGEREKDAGKEPDQSFCFSENSEIPGLAIEVVVSSEAIDKLSFYARFGIPEVWIWKNGKISVHILKDDSSGYGKAKQSSRFPNLDMDLVERCAGREKSGEAIAEFREAIAG